MTATAPAADEFTARTEPFRRELLAHCYRMLGSVDEAEDLVQETYLRAWRAYGRFEGRSSLRAWLYRIATNACLTALQQRKTRRWLPSDLVGPVDSSETVPPEVGADVRWVQPLPDALVSPQSDDPAAVVALRSSLRLALVATVQLLPPRQRAVLLLRDVLDWPAREVADVLGTSTAAVKSMLQRARARLDESAPEPESVREPTDAEARAQLDAYVAAFEQADVSRLEHLLSQDAALELIPSGTWFDGRRDCLQVIGASLGSPGDWRMLRLEVNGQPAAAAYRRTSMGGYEAFGIGVLTVTSSAITRITVFGEPALFGTLGLPISLAHDDTG